MAAFESTSLSLLARVQTGQAEAWNRFVQLYAPLVHYWCKRSGLNPEDTADIFQEIFRSVAENISTFQKEKKTDTLRGWLRIITSNKIRDHLRRQSGKPTAEGGSFAQVRLHAIPDPVDDREDLEETGILQQSVRKALDWIREDFEEPTWKAFWKIQIEEIPTDVVAEELGMTTAAVRKAKYRVLRRLREELEGLLDDSMVKKS